MSFSFLFQLPWGRGRGWDYSDCVVRSQIKLVIKSSKELGLGKGGEEGEVCGCEGMACPSIWGLVLPCRRLACPPAAPQGVTSSSRGFHRAHHPSQGPLKEKAAFCTDSGWRWADPGYLESGDQMSRCLRPCLGITRVPRIIASGSWGGSPETAAIPLGPSSLEGASRRWGVASYKYPLGPGSPAGSTCLAAQPRPGRGVGNSKPRAAWLRLTGRPLAGRTTGGGGPRSEGEGAAFGSPPGPLTPLPGPPPHSEAGRGPPRAGRGPGPRGLRRLARSPPAPPATICSGFGVGGSRLSSSSAPRAPGRPRPAPADLLLPPRGLAELPRSEPPAGGRWNRRDVRPAAPGFSEDQVREVSGGGARARGRGSGYPHCQRAPRRPENSG